MPASGFYAVANGRSKGIFHTWDDCKAQVDGFQGAKFKKFKTEAEAKSFVENGTASGSTPKTTAKSAPKLSMSSSSKKRARDDNGAAGSSKRKAGSARAASPPESSSGPTYRDGVRFIDVYTDGASSKNGQNGARAGWGVHFPEGASDAKSDLNGLDESRRLDGDLQTNNRAELMAIIRAIQLCPDTNAQLRIYTDSMYSIKCINEWQASWRRKGWVIASKEPVKNRDLVRKLERLMRARERRPILLYVKGHGNSEGNNEADRLAVAGATLPDVPKEAWEEHEPPPSDGEIDGVVARDVNRKRAEAMWARAGFQREEAKKKATAK